MRPGSDKKWTFIFTPAPLWVTSDHSAANITSRELASHQRRVTGSPPWLVESLQHSGGRPNMFVLITPICHSWGSPACVTRRWLCNIYGGWPGGGGGQIRVYQQWVLRINRTTGCTWTWGESDEEQRCAPSSCSAWLSCASARWPGPPPAASRAVSSASSSFTCSALFIHTVRRFQNRTWTELQFDTDSIVKRCKITDGSFRISSRRITA